MRRPVDLRRIDAPAYVLASREDHIVRGKRLSHIALLSSEVRFVLAASGHVAGVINPASRNKRNFWIDGKLGDRRRNGSTAREMPGSWWTDWSAWLRGHEEAGFCPRRRTAWHTSIRRNRAGARPIARCASPDAAYN